MAIYLQKAQNAKRIYATVVHAKNNSDGNKQQGIWFIFFSYLSVDFSEIFYLFVGKMLYYMYSENEIIVF